MTVIYLSLVVLFAPEFRDVHSSGNLDLGRWPSSNLSPQSHSSSTSNPCDATKFKTGAPDAHSACHDECLTIKAETRTIYNAYSKYKVIEYLYNKCGMVTEGRCCTDGCNSAQKAKHALQLDETASVPICWCHMPKESKNRQRNTLSNCLRGLLMMRKFTDEMTIAASGISTKSTKKRINGQEMGRQPEVEAVALFQFLSSRPPTGPRSPRPRRPNTRILTSSRSRVGTSPGDSFAGPSVPSSSLPQQLEEDWNTRPDGQPEGKCLCTDVRVSGNVVRAMIDTGSSFSIVHRKFVKYMVPFDNQPDANNEQITIFGRTTITLEIRKGISIPITGYVTDRKVELLLGTDFFVDYAAKIRISDETMEVFTGKIKVPMTIKYRTARDWVYTMDSHLSAYQPLQISARVNGHDTRMVIDTGSSDTIVNLSLVKYRQTLRPVAYTCSFGGSRPVGFLGATDVSLQIGSIRLTVPALVPEFIPTRNLLTGKGFIKQHVELIDYESKLVTLRFPSSSGSNRIQTRAFVMSGE